MNALVAMRVVHKEEQRYSNSDVAATHLVKGAAQYVGHLLLLHDAEWKNWGNLEETARTGRSPIQGHVFENDPELGGNVLSVLDRIGQQSGPGLAKRLNLQDVQTFLDLGGGAGTNSIAFCKAYSHVQGTIFDLKQTLVLTERVVKEAGLQDRISVHPGDFNTDSLGGQYDLILMSDILHYQGSETNAALVKKCFAHLRPGGRLIIKDRFLDESGTGPAWVTAFAVHILINTEKGQCYKTSEAMEWMQVAGFSPVEELEKTAVVQGVKLSKGQA
jgi:precorrin-6B methylase 2